MREIDVMVTWWFAASVDMDEDKGPATDSCRWLPVERVSRHLRMSHRCWWRCHSICLDRRAQTRERHVCVKDKAELVSEVERESGPGRRRTSPMSLANPKICRSHSRSVFIPRGKKDLLARCSHSKPSNYLPPLRIELRSRDYETRVLAIIL